MADQPGPVDYTRLLKRVENLIGNLEPTGDVTATVQQVIESILEHLPTELGIVGGRLYRRIDDVYVLVDTFGKAKPVPTGLEIPLSYPPIDLLLDMRTLYMDSDDPELDRDLESRLGVEKFAAIEVGDKEFLLAFDVAPGHDREAILYSLSILRFGINQTIRQGRMEDVFRQARRIQESIVPRRIPSYGTYDIFGRTVSMESVGGDHYDYIPITDKILGIAIADVSGHGLPAALLVRDIYMGLRMGLSRDYKIIRTVERLNSIIHKSTLTSRFVSMFYGELELTGNFIYVNAGHPAPFLLKADGSIRYLTEGGAVIGPFAQATYERGLVRLEPGDLLVLYTDGIVEATRIDESGTPVEFGPERLQATAALNRHRSAEEVVESIFDAVTEFTEGEPPEDDRTLVVVRYPS